MDLLGQQSQIPNYVLTHLDFISTFSGLSCVFVKLYLSEQGIMSEIEFFYNSFDCNLIREGSQLLTFDFGCNVSSF